MLTKALLKRRASRPQPPQVDILRELATSPAKFVDRVRAMSVPEYKRELLLKLVGRTEEELANDIMANWYIRYQGNSPIEHDYVPIPDQFLPNVNTISEFEQYLADFRKQKVAPFKTIRTDCKSHFELKDPAITEHSKVTVEIAPEIVEIQNGQMSFFLRPDGFQNLIVRIVNP